MLSSIIHKLIFAAALSATAIAGAQETTAPDILLITLDDLGIQVGTYGHPYVRTPNIDKLADQGIQFENAWVTQPGCSPSRGSIMTGLYPHQNGLVGLAHLGYKMDKPYPTIPALLKQAGYHTGVVGKVHVAPGPPFDYDVQPGKKLQAKNPAAYAEHVKKFLKQTGDNPYFLNVSFVDPHRPFVRQVNGLPEKPLTASEIKPLPFLGDVNTTAVREDVAGYYNNIMRADAGIGMVLDVLRKAGRLDNTLIILIGDHGAPFTRGKTSGYNSGYQIPFLVKWPGVSKAGTHSKALVSTIDILPTFLDAAGLPERPELPGLSLRKVVKNPEHPHRDYMFGEHTAHIPYDFFPRRTVRSQRYQLIHNLLSPRPNPEDGSYECAAWDAVMKHDQGSSQAKALFQRFAHPPEYELYDLQNDPHSFVNLADDPEHAETLEQLKQQIAQWQKRTGDRVHEPGVLQQQEEHSKQLHKAAMKQPKYRHHLITRGKLPPEAK